MPFDGTDFPARRDLPRRPKSRELATLLIIILTSGMLLVPLSLATVLNIVRYLHHS